MMGEDYDEEWDDPDCSCEDCVNRRAIKSYKAQIETLRALLKEARGAVAFSAAEWAESAASAKDAHPINAAMHSAEAAELTALLSRIDEALK